MERVSFRVQIGLVLDVLANRGQHTIYLLILLICYIRLMTYTYKIMQYENKPYSDNNGHHGSVTLTGAQHDIEWVKK